MRPVSKKRAKRLGVYHKLRVEFLEAHPTCAVFPTQQAIEIHHTAGRKGDMLNKTDDWIAVSRHGHMWIHDNPKEAMRLGFIKLIGK